VIPNVTETLIVAALSHSRLYPVDCGFVTILQKLVRRRYDLQKLVRVIKKERRILRLYGRQEEVI
jgi:predicted AAA+ superfamily ATPase